MKHPLSSIAVLVLSVIAGPHSFGAVADQDGADIPAPEVLKYSLTPETNEALTEVLNVNPEYPVVRMKSLKNMKGDGEIASRMSNDLGEIRQAIAKRSTLEGTG